MQELLLRLHLHWEVQPDSVCLFPVDNDKNTAPASNEASGGLTGRKREEEATLADFRRTWLRLWTYQYRQEPRPRWKLVPPSAWLGEAAGSFEAARVTSEDALAEAELMLQEKRRNPIGAAIGGYYLLRVGALNRLHDWPNNLANWFEWLPDGAVVHAWQLLREPDEAKNSQARRRLVQAAERGLPVYTEGVRLLIDGLELFAYDAVAHDERDEAVEQALQNIRRYAAAMDWNQQLTTFYGADPEKPSLKPVMGMATSKEEVDLHFLSTGLRRR